MGNYALATDVTNRLVPYKQDNVLFTETKINELIDAHEVEIDSTLLALDYSSVPLEGARDISLLKQKVIDATVADVLLQSDLELTDKVREEIREIRNRYDKWLEILRNGGIRMVDATTTRRPNRGLALATIDLGLDSEEEETE